MDRKATVACASEAGRAGVMSGLLFAGGDHPVRPETARNPGFGARAQDGVHDGRHFRSLWLNMLSRPIGTPFSNFPAERPVATEPCGRAQGPHLEFESPGRVPRRDREALMSRANRGSN